MSRALIKRLVVVSLLLTALFFNDSIRSSAKGPAIDPAILNGDGQPKSGATSRDCSYLNNRKILADPREHAQELSRQTVNLVNQTPSQPQGGIIKQLPDETSTTPPRRNYIDNEIFDKMDRNKVPSAPLSSDEEFLRRVSLDLTGRIPTPDQVKQFLADSSPTKRDQLIASLIGSPAYVDRWTMWLGDLMKNTAFSSNVNRYPTGRNIFHAHIRNTIEQNIPFNQFVTSVLSATGNSFQVGPVNYLIGAITPMGPAQDTYDTAMVQTATRFLGIETFDCLLCHDGQGHLNALNVWATNTKRTDAWGMAAFFSRVGVKRNLVSQKPFTVNFDLFELPSGQYQLNTTAGNRTPRQPLDGQAGFVTPKYIFTGETPGQSENYREALARFITKDRQFARATVNYLWVEFFGLGIVDPPSGFDLARLDPKNPPPPPFEIQPTHPELLEKLADDFIASGYNLQHIMQVIAQSNAYQLSARYNGQWKEEYTPYFARKLVRRLDAEEMHDAITIATGVYGYYQVIGFSQPVQFAMQFPDTLEPVGSVYGGKNDPVETSARLFLNTFQRGNRDQVPRSSEPSILQGLSLMNSQFLNARLRSAANTNGTLARLLAANTSDQQLIEDIFLTVLSRRPTSSETAQAANLLKVGRAQGAEDLMWVLLNKIDFLYNY